MKNRKAYDFSDTPITSRKEAKALGLKRYFTGVPCTQGHIAPRYTKFCRCVMCSAEGALAWEKRMYLENVEEIRRRNRARRHADPIGEIIRVARSRAKKRGIEFSITRADVPMPESCPCCARKLVAASGKMKQGGRPESPSLDRFDGALGYVPGNVTVICWRCNELKRNASLDELEKIVAWMRGRSISRPILALVS